jgi:hypothetical protein
MNPFFQPNENQREQRPNQQQQQEQRPSFHRSGSKK